MKTLTPAERKAIADAALAVAKEYAGLDVASLDELLDMDQSELDAYMAARGVEIDWERLEDNVMLQLGQDALRLDRGQELSPAVAERVQANAEKALVQGARDTANVVMGAARRSAMLEDDPRPESEQFSMWVTVGSGCCLDCFGLHGVVFRNDYWTGHEPRDGETVCGLKCRCSLVPCGNPGDTEEGLRSADARSILRE